MARTGGSRGRCSYVVEFVHLGIQGVVIKPVPYRHLSSVPPTRSRHTCDDHTGNPQENSRSSACVLPAWSLYSPTETAIVTTWMAERCHGRSGAMPSRGAPQKRSPRLEEWLGTRRVGHPREGRAIMFIA